MGKHNKRQEPSTTDLLHRICKLEKLIERRLLQPKSRSRSPRHRRVDRTRSRSSGSSSHRQSHHTRRSVASVAYSRTPSPAFSTKSVRHPRRHFSRSPTADRLPSEVDNSPQIFSDDRADSGSTFARNDIADQVFNDLAATVHTKANPSTLNLGNEDANDVVVIHNDVVLPEETLKILGHNPDEQNKQELLVHAEIANRWKHLVSHGLNADEFTGLCSNYSIPKNCDFLLPPSLNPEISAILTTAANNRDNWYVDTQRHLGHGLSALGQGIHALLGEQVSVPSNSNKELLTAMSDAAKIFAHVFHHATMTRRRLILPALSNNARDLADKSLPSEFLFGSDLGEKVKAAKNLQISSKDLKNVPSYRNNLPPKSNRTLNQRGNIRRPALKKYPGEDTPLNRSRPGRLARETRPTKGQSSNNYRREKYRTK